MKLLSIGCCRPRRSHRAATGSARLCWGSRPRASLSFQLGATHAEIPSNVRERPPSHARAVISPRTASGVLRGYIGGTYPCFDACSGFPHDIGARAATCKARVPACSTVHIGRSRRRRGGPPGLARRGLRATAGQPRSDLYGRRGAGWEAGVVNGRATIREAALLGIGRIPVRRLRTQDPDVPFREGSDSEPSSFLGRPAWGVEVLRGIPIKWPPWPTRWRSSKVIL